MKNIKYIIKRVYMLLFKSHILYRMNSVGRNCFIGRRANINGCKYIFIGDNLRIGNDVRISVYDTFNGSKLNPKIIFGNNVYIGNRFSVLCADSIIIEDNVLIASDVMITSENHGINPEMDLCYGKQSLITKPVKISEGVWLGEKVSILPGVTIGKKSIIGTASVVTTDIPPFSIAVGSPAKVIKKYSFEDKCWKRV